MGYLRHRALLVNGWDAKRVGTARDEVAALYEGASTADAFGSLVSPLLRHVVNGGASFVIAPDGSKEGWLISEFSDALMEQAKQMIARHKYVDWCELLCGGDDDEFAVLAASGMEARQGQDAQRLDGEAATARPDAQSPIPNKSGSRP